MQRHRENNGSGSNAAQASAQGAGRAWHALPPDDVLATLQTSTSGLSAEEAAARLERYGPNQMRVAPPLSLARLLLDQLRSIVVLLLAVAALVSFLVGDLADALAIGAVLVINTGIGFFTELRARRALVGLLRIDVAIATALRDGRAQDVDARTLVPGDVIVLEAGQQAPADARLLDATDLQMVEAPLTGESIPVLKDARTPLPAETALPDRINLVYKATTAASGRAHAVVFATGVETEVGRIGGLASSLPEERTPLERKLDQLGRRLALLAVAAAALVAVVGWLRGLSTTQLLETALALAVAAVPEGLPAVATITLALGVHRMARRNALVRRLPSVETLGSVTVICSDKTGTLTAGEVTATVLWIGGREIRMEGENLLEDAAVRDALYTGVLANRADLHIDSDTWQGRGDPTEIALLVAAARAGLRQQTLQQELPEVAEVPFSSERRWMATVHRVPDTGELRAFVKGAAATVLERCSSMRGHDDGQPLDEAARETVLAAEADLAGRGLRVLALAAGRVPDTRESALTGLELIGLVGMIDPPAEGVHDTIAEFRKAGIRTVMITGDQRRTAEAVAAMLDMRQPDDDVIDGIELDRMDDQELLRRLPHIAAFSRIAPEAKLRLVRSFQQRGDIVAMLGDGINDAAALRKSDVGVAMGKRGTDVAKEAASVVLQDDRFQTIGVAIREGRIVFDNIRKFVFYLFSCNLAEVLVLVGAGAAGLPLPLLPLQILWLNIVTDTFPALALAVEPGEPDVMERPPRDPQKAILSRAFIRSVFLYGAIITAATLAAFVIALRQWPEQAGTVAFMTLGLAQALHLGTARSTQHVLGKRALTNRLAIGAVLLVTLLQLATIYIEPLSRLLRVVPLDRSAWIMVVIAASLPAIIGQAIHARTRRRERRMEKE